ncbi:Inner membrane protein YbaN [Anatilimnocola aggregata]|uniref:Inner membrane protein YbaN n=1 Tax=Anatilimnocola aggregata TaxID=2528021 RepID=A0A517Y5F1_9BACT|nr:YbaN family protein [Anatilimnocola aggregata]QDU25467.1 Inner membrane protein YbaN [Anatilimnocola aggregata]
MMRAILMIAGGCCVLLALAGAVLPVLPCTPFVLLAAACFARSSNRALRRLRRLPLLGTVLRDWEQHRGMRPAAKFAALCLALATPVITFTLNPQLSIPLGVSLLGGLVAVIVVCRLPTVRRAVSEDATADTAKIKSGRSNKLRMAA